MNRQTIRDIAAMLGISPEMVTRYAKGTASGWIKRLLDAIFGRGRSTQKGRGTPTEAEVADALETSSRGRTPPQSKPGAPSPPTRPKAPPSPPRTNPPVTAPTAPQPSGEPLTTTFGANQEPPRQGEESGFGQEILVTNSSNVFSFSYNPTSSTLYVTYLAPLLNARGVSVGKRRKGRGTSREQLIGKSGRTISGKSKSRGPMYAYFDVPARVFQRMKLASSKGKFVWDELRKRGSMWGHKYRYSLVQGAVVNQSGVSGVYIPRKATQGGYRSRSVADVGTGKRGFQTSTLPAQDGFRTRSAPRRRK